MKKIQISETQICSESLAALQGESAAHIGVIEQSIAELKTVNSSLEAEEKKINVLIVSLTETLNASVKQRETNKNLIEKLSAALESTQENLTE